MRKIRKAAAEEKSGAGKQKSKTEDRRRKALYYGRFKFTATNSKKPKCLPQAQHRHFGCFTTR
jgi:hypothetical protein